MNHNQRTRRCLLAHGQAYPSLQTADVFKYLFQSAFGCEHLVSSEETAIAYIRREAALCGESPSAEAPSAEAPVIEPLDGDFVRVHLSALRAGLSPETLAKLFCRSANAETEETSEARLLRKETARADLEEKLGVARDMIAAGELPGDLGEFDTALAAWRERGYPAIHHSETFRAAYAPAYRVVARRYARLLPLLTRLDQRLQSGAPTILAIEGGSATGKTTLAALLAELYGANVFHIDDFFLRPEQRTPARYAEPGGNFDRERFLAEVLRPVRAGEAVCYRPFDCGTQCLTDPVTVPPRELTVIEGAYSMHPELTAYYDLTVLLEISPEEQQARIRKRNSPQFARRFFEEWIPAEERYFAQTDIRSRCDLVIQNEA